MQEMQEMRVQFLSWGDPLEKGMATHSNILAWKMPWTEEPGGLHTVHGVTKSQHNWSNLTRIQLVAQNVKSEILSNSTKKRF